MPSLPLYDMSKQVVGQIDLLDAIFADEIRPHLLNEAVRAQIAWKHEKKTANSRTRGEVTGTRKKMYRQKGTGRARHGDAKAPIFVGGGKAHGPKPRTVRYKLNKKVYRAALKSALSLHQKEDRLFVVNRLSLEKVSAKLAGEFFRRFGLSKALVVNSERDESEKAFNRSIKNIPSIKFLKPEGINVFDLLKFENLIISQNAVQQLSEKLCHV